MERKRVAIIEAGSRGLRLLVAERRPLPQGMSILSTAGQISRLAAAVSPIDQTLPPESIARSTEVIIEFAARALSFAPQATLLVGTEVFRRLGNREEVARLIPRHVQFQVLSIEEEAAGSFLAASWAFREHVGSGTPLVLFDFGGASIEAVVGRQGEAARPHDLMAFPGLGSLAMANTVMPPSHSATWQADIEAHAAAILAPHQTALEAFRAEIERGSAPFVAAMGSVITDAVWQVHSRGDERFRSQRVHGLAADIHELRTFLSTAARTPGGAASPDFGPTGDLGPGLAVAIACFEALGIPRITACGYGLRYGLAYAWLHGIPLGFVEG